MTLHSQSDLQTAPSRIVVIGGYGVFGSRVSERLARECDIRVVIAGRSKARAGVAAEALAKATGRTVEHAALDAATVDVETLRSLAAKVVVNASGPFQEQSYRLAQAAIACSMHYVDLADARGFVAGIGALDAAAREAGVLVVSGASTVPAVSSAVVDHFARQFLDLRAISYGISPGNSFDPGEATTTSILGAVGRPFSTRIAGRDQTVHGWQGLGRHRFPGIGKRWMSYCDVPDLTLFPSRYPSLETIRFKAGIEVGLFHLGVWLVAWLVRLGLLRTPERLAAPLLALKRRLNFLGTDCGGMFVSLEGTDAARRPKRIDWHLEATNGHGPYIPTIAAVILARSLTRGKGVQSGATACVGLVTLREILAEVADLDIGAYSQDTPLYARVLGQRFARLPSRVRELHDLRAPSLWRGLADVDRGDSLFSRLAGALTRLPAAGRDVSLSVTFVPTDNAVIWSRDFGGRIFRSRQDQQGSQVCETLGLLQLNFDPVVAGDGSLSLRLAGMRVLGVSVPRWLWPAVKTREWEEGCRYHFSVEARLPFGAVLVRYAGWLAQVR